MKQWLVAVTLTALVSLVATGAAAADEVNLNLEKCVDTALEVNVSVLKAGYDLDRARYSVLGSASALLPSASWSTSHGKWHDDESYGSGFSASERLSFGSMMGFYQSLASKSASAENLRAVRHDVAYTAKQKYLEVLKSDRLLAVSEEALDLSKRRLEKAQAMLDVGSGVRSDVLRAQVEVSSNELDLISARNALRLAETDLKHFLAIPDENQLVLEDILEAGEYSVNVDQALADAMSVRPDVRAGRHLVDASSRAVWGERGGWVPSLRLSYSRTYSAPEDDPWLPERTLDLWDQAVWSYDMSISVNLFDGFSTFSRVKSAKAGLKAAREELNQLKRDASLEVTTAAYNVEEAQQRVKVSTETVSLAEEELRLAEERYRLGGGTMLEQIDAQVALSEARASRIQALHDYLLSQAAMERAVGRD